MAVTEPVKGHDAWIAESVISQRLLAIYQVCVCLLIDFVGVVRVIHRLLHQLPNNCRWKHEVVAHESLHGSFGAGCTNEACLNSGARNITEGKMPINETRLVSPAHMRETIISKLTAKKVRNIRVQISTQLDSRPQDIGGSTLRKPGSYKIGVRDMILFKVVFITGLCINTRLNKTRNAKHRSLRRRNSLQLKPVSSMSQWRQTKHGCCNNKRIFGNFITVIHVHHLVIFWQNINTF